MTAAPDETDAFNKAMIPIVLISGFVIVALIYIIIRCGRNHNDEPERPIATVEELNRIRFACEQENINDSHKFERKGPLVIHKHLHFDPNQIPETATDTNPADAHFAFASEGNVVYDIGEGVEKVISSTTEEER